MEILKVNYEIGKKCFTRFNNEFHECIFLGTKSVKNDENNCWTACYVLNVAGVGIRYLAFDRFNQFNNWYHRTMCNTTLYETLDDCMKKANPITAQYGSTDNCYNKSFMQPFFKDCSVCNCGGSIYTYIWDGTDAVWAIGVFSSAEWTINENGFCMTAELRPISEVNNFRRVFLKGHAYKCYRTKGECLADNEPKVVTF